MNLVIRQYTFSRGGLAWRSNNLSTSETVHKSQAARKLRNPSPEGPKVSEDSEQSPNAYDVVKNISHELRNAKDEKEAAAIIAHRIRDATKADYAVMVMVQEGSPEVQMVGVSGVDLKYFQPLPKIGYNPQFRKIMAAGDRSNARRFDTPEELPESAKALVDNVGVKSAVICSIVFKGEILGYLAVASKRSPAQFPAGTESLLESIAEYISLVVDNTRAYLALKNAKSEADTILSMAPVGIFTMDSRGILNSVNAQMVSMLEKKSEAEMLGTSVFEIQPVTKSGLDALLMQGMEGHEGEKSDVHLVLRPDHAIYLHAKVTPIKDESGAVRGVMLVAMDMTTKVRLQNQLERSYERLTQTYQELERVATMKSQFIDVVSHELRTPLTVMRGYIDLIDSEYASKMDPKFASRLKIIKTNTDKLYSLVESMLDVSRMEKGSLQIHPEPVKIDAILEEAYRIKLPDAEGKKQTATLDVEGVMPLIMADRRRLKDVFVNIIDNAIKYTQEGGRIQVCARDEGKMIHVWVKDNGVGIPLENLGKIFDRFHIVASNDLSHEVNRLGLGLPIAKGII